jgi:hypothetical protein
VNKGNRTIAPWINNDENEERNMQEKSDGTMGHKTDICYLIIYGGAWLTVPELFLEKKQLVPSLQQLLVSHSLPT